MKEKALKRSHSSDEIKRLLGIVTAVVAIGVLYLARTVFIPLALAFLLALLLTPPVAFLERIKLPRSLAIFAVVLALIGLVGVIGWQTSQQFVDLTNRVPMYEKALKLKIGSMRGANSQSLADASNAVKELEGEIAKVTPGSSAQNGPKRPHPDLLFPIHYLWKSYPPQTRLDLPRM